MENNLRPPHTGTGSFLNRSCRKKFKKYKVWDRQPKKAGWLRELRQSARRTKVSSARRLGGVGNYDRS